MRALRGTSKQPAAAGLGRSKRTLARIPRLSAASDSFSILRDWIKSEGGCVDGLTVDDCRMGPAVVRGLVAQQPFSKGSTIMAVPFDSTFKDIDTPEAFPGAPWNVSLAFRMLREALQHQQSHWYPYLQSLPQEAHGPILLDPGSLPEIQYPPAIQAVLEYQQQAAASYDQLEMRYGADTPSWGDWLWALQMVQSRTIRFAVSSCRVMIPGIDLLNHGGSAANGQLLLSSPAWQSSTLSTLDSSTNSSSKSSSSGRMICFQATQDVPAGQQVLWSYGDRSNDDFFVYHGFCLPGNTADGVVLFEDMQELVAWFDDQQQQQHQGSSWQGERSGSSSGSGMLQLAESVAGQAAAQAAVVCSSPHIQGTTSSLFTHLLLDLGGASTATGQRQQQQQERGNSNSMSRESAQQLGAAAAERWVGDVVREHMAAAGVQRQLASLRLHQSNWGLPECPKVAPELVLRADGSIDVRCLAALAALAEQRGSNSSSSSSSWLEAVRQAVAQRCEQLLQQYPTSVREDEGLLSERGDMAEDALLGACLQYRLGKKQLLLAAAQAAGVSSVAARAW